MKCIHKAIFFAAAALLSFMALTNSVKGQLTNIPKVQATPQQKQKSLNFIGLINSHLPDYRKKKVPVEDRIMDLCPIYSTRDAVLQKVASRVLQDYGAIFVGDNNAFAGYKFRGDNYKFAAQCVFTDAAELRLYQDAIAVSQETIGGTRITLQKDAMAALLRARAEAASKGLSITPRGGPEAAGRSYEDTVRLWNSRFNPALNYWVKKGRIPAGEAKLASRLPTIQQVAKVLKWEEDGLWFSTDFSKSILYSVAAPGASQHLFFLALDVQEFGRKDVRNILEKHGWFQTVYSDLPHFTYMGISKQELPKRGLVYKTLGEHEFWVPGIE